MNNKNKNITSDKDMHKDMEQKPDASKGKKGGQTGGNGKDLEDLNEENADYISDFED